MFVLLSGFEEIPELVEVRTDNAWLAVGLLSHRACEVGAYMAGAHDRHPDIGAAELGAQRFREADDAVLGGRVRADEWGAEKPAHRRGVHHVTRLCRGEQSRHECTNTVDHTPQADIDRPGPILLGKLPL